MNFSEVSFNDTEQHANDASSREIPAWCVAYGFMAVAIVAGNGLSITIFTQRKLTQKMKNHFLVNLSVADMMVGVLAIPLYISLLFASHEATTVSRELRALQLGYTAVDVFTGLASVFTLNAVALERYYAVSHPIKFRTVPKRYYFIVVFFIWSVGAALSVLYFLTSMLVLPHFVFVYGLTITSLFSLLITCVAHASIWMRVKLWNSQQPNKAYERREKKLANALLLITVVFILTWCPFHVLNILGNFQENVFEDVPTTVIFFGKFLQYGNSLANPVIYSLKIPEFRAAIRRSFYGRRVRETRL